MICRSFYMLKLIIIYRLGAFFLLEFAFFVRFLASGDYAYVAFEVLGVEERNLRILNVETCIKKSIRFILLYYKMRYNSSVN